MEHVEGFALMYGRSSDESIQADKVRIEGREYLESPLIVYESTCPENRGWVHNISEHGLGLVGVKACVDEDKKFVIFAEEISEIPPCEVQAVCRWIKKQALDDELDAGFEIIEISENDRKRLLELVPTLDVDEKLRREERLSIAPSLPVYEAARPDIKGSLRDITEHGLRISGIKSSVGETKKFVLEIGRGSTIHGIEVEAVCRWARPRDADIDFESGYEIEAVFGDSFKKLVRLIPVQPAKI